MERCRTELGASHSRENIKADIVEVAEPGAQMSETDEVALLLDMYVCKIQDNVIVQVELVNSLGLYRGARNGACRFPAVCRSL